MTIDSTGRAHKPAGSPASTGGQFAAQTAPAAASATLDPYPEVLDADLTAELDSVPFAYLSTGTGLPFENQDAFASLPCAEAGYNEISLERSTETPGGFAVTGTWPSDFEGQFPEWADDEDWEENHGAKLDEMVDIAGLRLDRDENDGTFDLRADTSIDAGTAPTFRAADAALIGSDQHDTLLRLVAVGGSLDERLARFESTGQMTLDDEQFASFVDQYVTTALFSTHNNRAIPDAENGEYDETASENLSGDYDITDLTDEARQALSDQAASFLSHNFLDIERVLEERPREYDYTDVAHDLWLTRNGHGAGFWDRGLGELGQRLTKAANAEGSENLWVDGQGNIHVGH